MFLVCHRINQRRADLLLAYSILRSWTKHLLVVIITDVFNPIISHSAYLNGENLPYAVWYHCVALTEHREDKENHFLSVPVATVVYIIKNRQWDRSQPSRTQSQERN